jgi:hypothetical protein
MTLRLSVVVSGLACWLTAGSLAADDKKVEVLARGPVHEAYAEPAEREPAPTPIIPKEPPKPIEELPPDQKPDGANVQWMPGYWAWDIDKKDFIWVSGFWRNAPAGRTWVPGSWRKADDGWQWTGGFWAQAKADGRAEVEYLPRPPAPLDAQGPTTPAPSNDHIYAPGTWVYRDRYVWRPGYWYEHSPGRCWIPAHYRWTPAGYVFIDGYWDEPLEERGVLFAPVYIPPVVYSAPSYVYTPSYVVREDCLYGAFFCRRGYGSYYFGDYFAPSYLSLGFSAWCGNFGFSIGFGHGFYDPLFSYYNCGFRADAFWGAGVFDLYLGRYNGSYLCPPTTLIQQNTVINNITNINNSNVNTNNVNMLTSLTNADRGGRRRLTQVPESERQQFRAQAGSQRELAARRAQGEAQLASRPGAGGKTGRPSALTLETPPAPKGATRPLADPKLGGAPARPSNPALTANQPPPKPSALGKPGGKPTSVISPTGPNSVGAAGGPSRPNLKPPPAPKGGAGAPTVNLPTGNVPPKGGGAIPAPKGNLPVPKGPGLNPVPTGGNRPSPKLDSFPSRPTPAVNQPSPNSVVPPARPSFKPGAGSPPVTVPKPSPGGVAVPRPSAPAPRPSAAVPRSFAPPASSMMPRPGPSAMPRMGSAPAMPRMSSGMSRPMPSRPAAPPARPAGGGKRR